MIGGPTPTPPVALKRLFVFPHPEVLDALEQAIELGLPLKDACALAGTTLPTFKMWERRARDGDPLYVDTMQEIAQYRAKGMEARLKAIVSSGKWQAHAWLLGKTDPGHFGKHSDDVATANDPETLRRSYRGLAVLALEFIPTARFADFMNRVEAQIAAEVAVGAPGWGRHVGADDDDGEASGRPGGDRDRGRDEGAPGGAADVAAGE